MLQEVIVCEDPLNLLNREDNFDMAQCIFTLANLSQIALTEYIAAQVVAVIAAGPAGLCTYTIEFCFFLVFKISLCTQLAQFSLFLFILCHSCPNNRCFIKKY